MISTFRISQLDFAESLVFLKNAELNNCENTEICNFQFQNVLRHMFGNLKLRIQLQVQPDLEHVDGLF